jgi:hypothetical protein
MGSGAKRVGRKLQYSLPSSSAMLMPVTVQIAGLNIFNFKHQTFIIIRIE